VYPELFSIGSFSVSTFGLMLAIAFLVGAWITSRRLEEEGLDPEEAWTILIYVMIGGIGGSKLYFAFDVWLRTGQPLASLLFSRGGITWYGGLIGATALGAWGCRRRGIPVKTFVDCTAVAGAVGQALGRVGCLLVGDDYGKPSDLPWAIAFPRGTPPTHETVHPTQLYEIAWLVPVAALLWLRRRKSPFLFGEYVALGGLGRLVIENWRVNPPMLFGLTEPQLIGIGLIACGAAGWLHYRRVPS
jgi:phosphatidylglycerol:prolipoprotein diacylglycerol transferase